jgi:hypothetical protein
MNILSTASRFATATVKKRPPQWPTGKLIQDSTAENASTAKQAKPSARDDLSRMLLAHEPEAKLSTKCI